MDRYLPLLVLQRLPHTAAGTLLKLYLHFGTTEAIMAADSNQLQKLLPAQAFHLFERFRNNPSRSAESKQALKDLDYLHTHRIKLLSIEEEQYPTLLKEISHAPPLLMVDGDIDALSKEQIAMVGSRKASPSGLETAEQFALEMASLGFVITSGLALGIDTASHQGALHACPQLNPHATIAVIATGMDTCYPSRNQRLRDVIRERGAVISEFPLGTAPKKENFPRRNRIISGLTKGVLVVEAELESGSLITAKYSLEQNREVFAVPGSIKNPASRGCHQLIREGAKLVECTDDVLTELQHPFGQIKMDYRFSSLAPTSICKSQAPETVSLDDDECRLLEFLDNHPVAIDQIVRRSRLPVEEVASLLVRMELKGILEMQEQKYRRR